MSKINTFLGLANLGAEMATAAKIEEMRQQNVAAAIMQTLIKAVRDEIFQYNEAAKDILTKEKTYPKESAGAMCLLKLQLRLSGLKSEMFLDLSDKEYMSNTVRFIHENAVRLKDQLSAGDQAELETMVKTAELLPDRSYYVNHYQELQDYRKVKPISRQSNEQFFGILAILVGGGFITLALCGLLASLIDTDGFMIGMSVMVMIMGVPALLLGIYLSNRGGKGAAAKKVVNKIEKEVDIERMEALDKEYGGNLGAITQKRNEIESVLKNFFGESDLLLI